MFSLLAAGHFFRIVETIWQNVRASLAFRHYIVDDRYPKPVGFGCFLHFRPSKGNCTRAKQLRPVPCFTLREELRLSSVLAAWVELPSLDHGGREVTQILVHICHSCRAVKLMPRSFSLQIIHVLVQTVQRTKVAQLPARHPHQTPSPQTADQTGPGRLKEPLEGAGSSMMRQYPRRAQ